MLVHITETRNKSQINGVSVGHINIAAFYTATPTVGISSHCYSLKVRACTIWRVVEFKDLEVQLRPPARRGGHAVAALGPAGVGGGVARGLGEGGTFC